MPTWDEIEDRYNKQLAAQQAAKERAEAERIRKLEELGNPDLSMEEYVAKRTGREYVPPVDLGSLSMEDYIKYRKQGRPGV